MGRLNRRLYQEILTVIGATALITCTWLYWPVKMHWGWLSITLFFTALLFLFPLNVKDTQFTLISVITLGTGLLYGPLTASWAMLLGLVLGWGGRKWLQRFYVGAQTPTFFDIGFTFGANVIPILSTLCFWGWQYGFWRASGPDANVWSQALVPAILFGLVHGLFNLLNIEFSLEQDAQNNLRDVIALILIEAFPIPLILLVLEAYPLIGDKALAAIGAIPVIIAILMFGMSAARHAQDRRVQELSLLERVSQTLRSTLELDQLLPVIQEQVAYILGLNNFYVALVDSETDELWYPLAVKNGELQNWNPRDRSDRLTDRVIQERRPITLTPQTQAGPNPVGLPPGESTPASWLGVPLIVADRAIGCLAVSELSTGVEFSQADVELLSILSGQVSVAIDNALLYQQAQRRAAQLETLNQLSTQMTASLNLKEVLASICDAVAQVGSASRSGIYLISAGSERVELEYARNLDADFIVRNSGYDLANSARTRCLRTGLPNIVAEINQTDLPEPAKTAFHRDDIRALADFPMTAPDGKLGFLTVFYSTPYDFSDEEIELLTTLASQAALAVLNARKYALTDEALARRVDQLAILDAVGRELSSAMSSENLFMLILDYALEFTHSNCGAVLIYHPDSHQLELKASRGYSLDQQIFSVDQSLTGLAVETRQTVNVGDVSLESRGIHSQNSTSRSQLSVPIIHEQRVLGAITLESAEPNAFDTSEQSLAQQLANHAAIALINAELYSETQRRLREQSTLYQVSTRMVGILETSKILTTIYQAIDALISPLALGIYLQNPAAARFDLMHSQAQAPTDFHFPAQVAAHQMLDRLATSSPAPIIQTAAQPDGIFALRPAQQLHLYSLQISDQVLGFVVILLHADRTVQHDACDLCQTIVAQGSIALQNAQLYANTTNDRERLAAIINSVREGLIIVNPHGQIMLVNEPVRGLSGVPLEEILHASIIDLHPDLLRVMGYSQADLIQIQKTLDQGKIPTAEIVEYQVEGLTPPKVLARETSVVSGPDQTGIGWMIVLRDKTEEFEISQAREMITATLVHDLRSPMSAVVGSLDLMDSVLGVDERDEMLKKAVGVANRAAARVLKLVESLLDIAKLEAGKMELIDNPINLRAIIGDLIADFEISAREVGLTLESEIALELPTIMADQEKITRVLMNLLDNAIKFTPEGGHVRISAHPAENHQIKIQVQDSGLGIPEEYRKKIFDRFTQIPGYRSRTRRGSGLGLAFCSLVVEAHGGKIWVESPQGPGSIFSILLPVS